MRENFPFLYSLYRFSWQVIDLIFPPRCVGCEKLNVRWCEACKTSLVKIEAPFCHICGLPQKKSGVCEKCSENRPVYEVSRSWLSYEGAIADALKGIKYHRNLGMGEQLAYEILPFVKSLNWNIDLVIPVPLGKQRMKERGYNQVSTFARPLALAMGWTFAPKMLKRVKETKSQVDLTAIERMENVQDAFVANREGVNGKFVLVLDDVSTTGATLNSCADALMRGGAKAVYVLTIARALPHHGLRTI